MGNPDIGSRAPDPFSGSKDTRPAEPTRPVGTPLKWQSITQLTRPETWNLPAERRLGPPAKSAGGPPSVPGDDSTKPALNTRTYLAILSCVISLTLGLLALKASPQANIGPYGLIQALSPLYYVAIGLVLLSFVQAIKVKKYRSPILAAHLAVLVILLQGAPGIVESTARFPTAWLTGGFTDYIAGTGKLLPELDARFSWPSFFAASAMLDKAAGASTADVFVRWWPTALNLLYLPLIFRISKEFLGSDVKAWVATALFPMANWIGQDYYSPQSIAFLLYLAFFFILIGPLGANDPPAWHSFWPLRRRKLKRVSEVLQQPRSSRSPRGTGFYLGMLVLLMAAMATGHQLTPIMATLTALALVLAGRTRIRLMVVFFGLMTFAWICYGAYAFWSGHRAMLIGGLGSLMGNVSGSVAGGSGVHGSVAHEYVLDSRLFLAVMVWLLAIVGALLWRPKNGNRVALVLCFFAPFATLAGGDYGGEGGLRSYLFSLPPAICLIVAALSRLRWSYAQVALSLVLLLLVPLFLVARWGNELFEMLLPDEVTAASALYHIAPAGSELVTVGPAYTLEFADVNKYNYGLADVTALGPEDVPEIIQAASGNPKGAYVVMTTDEINYGWQNDGMPRTWGATVEGLLSQSPDFKLVYSNPDAEIFQYVPGGGSK
jgi:hypothetical protein